MSGLDAATIRVADEPARQGVLRILSRNPFAVGSLVVLALFGAVALTQQWITPNPPNLVQLRLANTPPFTDGYVLGGDKYGRDIFSRLIASTRGAFEAALVLSLVATLVGGTAGLIAGYFGRSIDSAATFLFSVVMAVPGIVILISIYTLLGSSPTVAMAVFGFLVSPSMFWIVRTLTRSVRSELYVDAARVSGLSTLRVVGRHVLLAIRAPVILMIAGLAGAGIATQAGLEFLGLGDPKTPSWGGMLAEAFNNIYVSPIQIIWPAIALGLVTAAFSLISIGLRDALEGTFVKPSRRERRRQRSSFLAASGPQLASSPASLPNGPAPMLAVRDLSIGYPSAGARRSVVEQVSLDVNAGEVVGVVGESGSGKTQTVFATLGLLPDEAVISGGSIRFEGRELVGISEHELRKIRGPQMAYVPQEPTANLDPSFTVGSQLVFAIRAQNHCSKTAAKAVALEMLERVGIREPSRVFRSYPHQISGGMAQRVLIASAVAGRPKLLIADEPTTALDVTIQAEVLDLLRDLQRESGMGVLIVTHNFGVIADICDRVIVMRSGRVIEEGTVSKVFSSPQDDYTQLLLDSVLDNAPARAALEDPRTVDV